MRVHHVLNRVCNDVPGGQAIEHAIVTHGDAIIDRNGVEFFGDTARVFNFARDQLSQIFKMDVPRHELRERVNDGNDGFLKVTVFHAGCTPQGTCSCHIAAGGGCSRAILRHQLSPVDYAP